MQDDALPSYQQLRADPILGKRLEERASILATQKVDTGPRLGEEVLIFRLGEGRYGLPARFVQEVQPLTNYAPLPSTPPFVVGLVNVRGRLLSAIDIRPLLDMVRTPPDGQPLLCIVQANGMDVCLLADEVLEVRREDTDLVPSLAAAAGQGVPWVRGVDRDLNILLDPPLMLADPRLIVDWETE